MGGLRSAAQLISYEIPVVLVAAAVAILAQSTGHAGNRVAAVDLSLPGGAAPGLRGVLHCRPGRGGTHPLRHLSRESEVVGGPFVEYSGAHWSVFFLAEYINTFAIAALTTLLFLGGWGGPALPDVVWFLLKTYAVVLVVFWVRGTFPRLRIDQLMAFAWKVMVPLSFYTVIIAAVYRFYDLPWWSLTLMSSAGLAVAGWIIYRRMTGPARGSRKCSGSLPRGGRPPEQARNRVCWYHIDTATRGSFHGHQHPQNHRRRVLGDGQRSWSPL